MIRLQLEERQWKRAGDLTAEERRQLRGVRVSSGDGPRRLFKLREARGGWEVRSEAFIGSVSTAGCAVSISPRCGFTNFVSMLEDLGLVLKGKRGARQVGDLFDILAERFLRLVEEEFVIGLTSVVTEARLTGERPRGSIDFGRFVGPPPRLAYRTQLASIDSLRYRLVVAALRYLSENSLFSLRNRRTADFFRGRFLVAGVKGVGGADLEFATEDELCAAASQILLGRGDSYLPGLVNAEGGVVNAYKVFEDWLGFGLAACASPNGFSVYSQGRVEQRWLDRRRQLPLRPDYVLVGEDGRRVVVDSKYKYSAGMPSRDDLYQLFAYGLAYSATSVAIVHPGEEQVSRFEYMKDGLIFSSLGMALQSQDTTSAMSSLSNFSAALFSS